jgi:flagellar biosynthesis component FlhA
MQTQQIKNFFLFSLSVSILFTAWKYEQRQALYDKLNQDKVAEEKASAEKIHQEKIDEQKAKKTRLDEYYTFELSIKHEQFKCFDSSFHELLFNEVEKIKEQMLQDGYDRAEVDEIYIKSFNVADKRMIRNAKEAKQKQQGKK